MTANEHDDEEPTAADEQERPGSEMFERWRAQDRERARERSIQTGIPMTGDDRRQS
jgi:hypothetical protein